MFDILLSRGFCLTRVYWTSLRALGFHRIPCKVGGLKVHFYAPAQRKMEEIFPVWWRFEVLFSIWGLGSPSIYIYIYVLYIYIYTISTLSCMYFTDDVNQQPERRLLCSILFVPKKNWSVPSPSHSWSVAGRLSSYTYTKQPIKPVCIYRTSDLQPEVNVAIGPQRWALWSMKNVVHGSVEQKHQNNKNCSHPRIDGILYIPTNFMGDSLFHLFGDDYNKN